MNLSHLDFNLLRVLDTLIAERNVTRSAELLHRSQPAVSNALRRLRTLLGDDLLVRGSKGGLVLTPRAERSGNRCGRRSTRLKNVLAAIRNSIRRGHREHCG